MQHADRKGKTAMEDQRKFELDDDVLDSVAGGLDTDAVQTGPTAQALARGMTQGMVYQVKQSWAKCDCGSDCFVVTGFLDTGFMQRCEQCGCEGTVTYAVYDMTTTG